MTKKEIGVFDFVRTRNDKKIKIVTSIDGDIIGVVGIGLSEDGDTIICRSSVHHASDLEYVEETAINVAGPLWLIRDELNGGHFERMVYDEAI